MRIESHDEKTVVIVPAHRYLLWVLYLMIMPVVGVLANMFQIRDASIPSPWSSSPSTALLYIFVTILVASLCSCLLLYFLRGQEIFTISREYLIHRYHIFSWLGYERRFDMRALSHVRGVTPDSFWKLSYQQSLPERWGIRNGALAFEFQKRTYRMGSNLTQSQGWQLASLIDDKRL